MNESNQKPRREKKRWSKKRKIITFTALAVVLALLVTGTVYALQIIYTPQNLFKTVGETEFQPTPTPTPSEEAVTEEPVATEEVELSDYERMLSAADLELMKDTVNVLCIGVDYAEERLTWGGKKAFHADVMMVMAINFKENTVDLISLPRDTYAKIPGVEGIYKLNASLDCGGGFPEGFPKVCEAASWMLGGIPVDYYMAVTMPAVKELVNVLGGVDYDLELNFTLAGRSYKKGQQHMDGQAVLDYLRVRKNIAQGGDANRVNRQKKMLVAIFQELKNKDIILKIPDILTAFDGQFYTNMGFDQMAALALFAYKLNSEEIGMYSMGGPMDSVFNWSFCLTNQDNRVEIIKEVYGIDVPKYKDYSPSSARLLWEEMKREEYVKTGEKVLDALEKEIQTLEKQLLDLQAQADKLQPTATPAPTPTVKPTPSPEPTVPGTEPTTEPSAQPTGTDSMEESAEMALEPMTAPSTSANPRLEALMKQIDDLTKDLEDLKLQQETIVTCIETVNKIDDPKDWQLMRETHELLKTTCDALSARLGVKCSWNVTYDNEIEVDFR